MPLTKAWRAIAWLVHAKVPKRPRCGIRFINSSSGKVIIFKAG
jgi:hypothetical protein